MDRIFEGLPGVHIIVDDISVAGSTVEQHDGRLRATLVTARKNGIKFNPKKIQRCSTEVKFFGEMLTKDEIKPDPEKVAAAEKMSSSKSKKELECQLGMFTYLSKYSPRLSQKTASLRELCKEDREWIWCPEHEEEFTEIKKMITEVPGPILQYYDPESTGRCLTVRRRSSGYAEWAANSIRLAIINNCSTSVCADRKGSLGSCVWL